MCISSLLINVPVIAVTGLHQGDDVVIFPINITSNKTVVKNTLLNQFSSNKTQAVSIITNIMGICIHLQGFFQIRSNYYLLFLLFLFFNFYGGGGGGGGGGGE